MYLLQSSLQLLIIEYIWFLTEIVVKLDSVTDWTLVQLGTLLAEAMCLVIIIRQRMLSGTSVGIAVTHLSDWYVVFTLTVLTVL